MKLCISCCLTKFSMHLKQHNRIAFISLLCGLLSIVTAPLVTAGIPLAVDGRTDYVIATAAGATPVDAYAAAQLALYLQQITDAEFPQVEAEQLSTGQPALFIGLSGTALERLGETDPLADLEQQDFVLRTHNGDIFLYGNGVHSSLNAVMAFLETKLGWRWYSPFEIPVVPKQSTVNLDDFHETRGFSYLYRDLHLHRSMDYPYQLGANMRFDKRSREVDPYRNLPRDERPLVSAMNEIGSHTHSLHHFIPPTPNTRGAFEWLENKNYFKTNPEFFTMLEDGRRVPNKQLCFSNPQLREEFTRNVLRLIEIEGDDILLDVAAMDSPGRFCEHADCIALEDK